MKPFLFGALSLFLPAGLALAQTPAPTTTEVQVPLIDETKIVTSVTQADLEALVKSWGHTFDRAIEGSVSVIAVAGDGTSYYLIGGACSDAGTCQGIYAAVAYTGHADTSLEAINEVDVAETVVGIYKSEERLVINRYLILDGGVGRANLKVEIEVLLTVAKRVATKLAPPAPS